MQKNFRELSHQEKMNINGGENSGVLEFIKSGINSLFGWLWS